jgi:hypothetical protein
MQLSLRKANALQILINDEIKNIVLSTKVELNEFEPAAGAIDKVRVELFNNIDRKAALMNALYSIRELVSDANSATGISKILAKLANIEKLSQMYVLLASSEVKAPDEVIKGKLYKISDKIQSERNMYHNNDTVTTSVILQQELITYRERVLSLKKEKQQLSDQLLEKNVSTKIVLDNTVVALLTTANLL